MSRDSPRGGRKGSGFGLLALGAILAGAPAQGANFIVNNNGDVADFANNGICETATGNGTCTLRAAIMESNFAGVANTIDFALPGPFSIAVGAAGLPAITRAVTIDGYSQAGSAANTLPVGSDAILLIELNGAATGAGVNGLTIAAPATVRGLVINRFAGYGILVAAGGATSVIAGNRVGTNTAGSVALANNRDGAGFEGGIGLLAGGVTVGGTAPADRNLVSGQNLNFSRGIELYNSSGNTIQGNYVGTNAAGSAAIGNVGAGIGIDGDPGVGSDNNLIGGAVAGAGNLCSGGGTEGIYVSAPSNGNTIQGNVVGLNAAGTVAIPNAAQGIKIQSPGNLVGGDTAAKGNRISGNGSEGIRIEGGAPATGNAIVGNRIYGNGTLGIDLGAGDGVTGNDPLDGDGGPNNLLNFPVINSVSVAGASLFVTFSLDVPAGSYRVEFFRNPSGVDVPNGEGEVFSGFQNVNHGGAGSQSFSATITGVAGDRITATATSCSDGGVCAAFTETSEFGANRIATPANYRSIGAAANYTLGTITVTNSSTTVTATGTTWVAANRGRGDRIFINGVNYVVAAVNGETSLTLTTPYAGASASYSSPNYLIARQFTTLTGWEDCVDGPGGVACPFFPVASASLIADNRSEVGIAYDDTVGTDLPGGLVIDGAATDATHTITLTADGDNRHYGLKGQGVLIDNGASVTPAVSVFDDFVTVEWLEITGGGGTADGVRVNLLSAGTGSLVTVRNNLVRNITGDGVAIYDPDGRVDVMNNLIHSCTTGACSGIWLDSGSLVAGSRFRVLNNTIYACASGVAKNAGASAAATLLLRNNISFGNTAFPDYEPDPLDSLDPASSNNLSEDGSASAAGASPAGGGLTGVTLLQVAFVSTTVGSENLHIQSSSVAQDTGANLSGLFTTDIDAALRATPWDIGADEVVATALFRSVGITATPLATGAANLLAIAGSTASFASGLPTIIGVGDVIQYDSDNNGSIDALAFIHGRTTSQTYTVRTRSGAAPTATAAPDADWALYRAYTSLFNWEAQTENASLNAGLRDFDTSTDLLSDNTTMNVACYGDGDDTTPVVVAGWTTGVNNYIRIYTPFAASEVGASQRHSGTWNSTTAYRIQAALGASSSLLWLQEENVRVDGLQFWLLNDVFYPAVIYMNGAAGVASFDISNNIVRGVGGSPSQPGRIGINTYFGGAAGSVARIWNNLVYDFSGPQVDVAGILPDATDFTHYIYNNTVVDGGQGIAQYRGTVIAKNNLVYNNLDNYNGAFSAASTNNLSGPIQADAPGTSPRNAATVTFVSAAADDFHLSGSDVGALNQGANLSADANLAIAVDIDRQVRLPLWDIGADDATGTTEVTLVSFAAAARDGAVDLSWTTASELRNLGFHLYRSASAAGPFARITASPIPGLGSSPTGKSYSYRDGGLVNGQTYFYELEDIETSGQATRHGPVSATPASGAEGGDGSDGAGGSGGGGSGGTGGTTYGDAGAPSLRILERGPAYAVLELRTPGFVAVSAPDGTVHLEIPGFELPLSPGLPAVPLKRAFVDALAGRGAHVASVQAEDLVAFSDLRVEIEGRPEVVVTQEGVVKPGLAPRKPLAGATRGGYYPRTYARLLGVVFQGETKKARLELSPLRYDASSARVRLARRLVVRVEFTGVDAGEKSLGGARGRRPPAGVVRGKGVVAQFATGQAGLYRVGFESVFGNGRGVPVATLRLSRQGEAVPFHVEPARALFGPGSWLYFVGGGDLNPNGDMVYELERGRAGTSMTTASAVPSGPDTSTYEAARLFEENHYYQAALLDAPDRWLWDLMVSPASRSHAFTLSDVDTGSAGRLKVWLQGASDFEADPDHHVRVSVNGSFIAEGTWDGKREQVVEGNLVPGILQEGANTLTLESVGDTPAAYSMLFLNRFEVKAPRNAVAEGGRLEGLFTRSGSAALAGLAAGSVVLDTTELPAWLSGGTAAAGIFRFQAEAGRRYLAVDPTAMLAPEVRRVPNSLRRNAQRADWLLLAPREFLPAAQTLAELRREQGLVAKTVALEDVYQEFGFGEAGPQAIRAFLAYAYQSWRKPSPRYVVLLGDSTYDPKDYLGTRVADRLPFYPVKTSFLWTASDPAYAAVNGDDLVPDLAIGRLPAGSLAEAFSLVAKVVAFERAAQTLEGRAVLVADNADLAGAFEAEADDLAATVLAGRATYKLYLRDLGAGGTRAETLAAFDSGAALLSYIGHGGTAVWASENVFNNQDVSALATQARQPFLLTMNCLNGFFHFPPLNSLAEELVKAEGKGAIAAFSPSGLSLDHPAHVYHKAVLAEIASRRHGRLGDALLAAQAAYADTGSFPELLSIYHLFGDPALQVR